MKHFNKPFRCILMMAVIAAMLAGTAVAAGNITKKTIEANYRDIKIVVDGVEITPKDASGKVVEPFISEGTTYLPVRAVGEALGKEVTWDGSTKTVYIGKVPGTEDNWMTKLPPYQVSGAKIFDGKDPKQSFQVAGVTQTCGVTFSGYSFAIWNTNAEYETMTFTVGHTGNSTKNSTLEVYLDGEYSTEYELKFDAAPKTITVDLKYAPNVKLVVTRKVSGDTENYAIYDVSFS